MNGHTKTHGKYMLIGGVGITVLAVVLGAGWQQAATWGLLLACPMGMLGMMWLMGRQGVMGHQHGGQADADHGTCHDHGPSASQDDVSEPFVPGPRRGV